jgi:hypothetical protein
MARLEGGLTAPSLSCTLGVAGSSLVGLAFFGGVGSILGGVVGKLVFCD